MQGYFIFATENRVESFIGEEVGEKDTGLEVEVP